MTAVAPEVQRRLDQIGARLTAARSILRAVIAGEEGPVRLERVDVLLSFEEIADEDVPPDE